METNRVLPLTESMKLGMLNYIDKPAEPAYVMRTLALATIEQVKRTLANPNDWIITVDTQDLGGGNIKSKVSLCPLVVEYTWKIDTENLKNLNNGK